MIYMLDTDTCSYIMRQHSVSVLETLQDRASKGHILCMSVITYQELRFGAERVGSAKYHARIDQVCERFDYIADWTSECADQFAFIQTAQMNKGRPIGFADTMIASHAMILEGILVTNNQKHFSQVDGLQLENWFSPS